MDHPLSVEPMFFFNNVMYSMSIIDLYEFAEKFEKKLFYSKSIKPRKRKV